ncbi:MAG: ribokinase [Chloroflexota bacterium]
MAKRVAVVGSLNADLSVRVGRLPGPGETVLGEGFLSSGGGKGANQAVAAARLGSSVHMIGCVGDDAHGRELLDLARADGIDVGCVVRRGEPTGVALIVVDGRGQNLIAVASGANGALSPADVEGARDTILASDLAVAQLEVPIDAVEAAARLAGKAGIPLLLNAAPAQPGLDGLLGTVSVLVVNETELALLAGLPSVPEGSEAHVAAALLERGPRAVVVTLGSRGAVLVRAGSAVAVPALDVAAVDATAAGDSFVGALAASFRGLDGLEDGVRYACAAAALTCTRPGAQPSLPTAAEVEAFRHSLRS